MESRGRRSPRMAAPADTPPSHPALEAMDPVRADEPLDESPPPDVVVQRIAPPVSEPLPAPVPAARLGAETEPDIFAAIAKLRAALAHGVELISEACASFARHSIDTTARCAIQMLGIKTWADAVTVNTGFARTSLDLWLDSTAKVSELGVKLAVESSKPFVGKFGNARGKAHPGR